MGKHFNADKLKPFPLITENTPAENTPAVFLSGYLRYHAPNEPRNPNSQLRYSGLDRTLPGRSGPPHRPPYLDAEISDLEEHLPFDPDAAKRRPELFEELASAAETSLAESPGDLALRLAALYPLRRAALSNCWEKRGFRTHRGGEEVRIFKHLEALCVPEKLSGLNELKFELHNAYLAANWEKAEALLVRLALIGLLEPAEMHFLRGQFWFLSVFGRQIQFEMSEDDFMCEWVNPSPGGPLCGPAFDRFARPELLEKGSPAHWVLTAWSTNPKFPEPFPGPDLPQIGDEGLLFDPFYLKDGSSVRPWTNEERRAYWHGAHREFKPIEFRNLTPELKCRLSEAAEDLQQGINLNETLAICYRPLLGRTEFALGNFRQAGAVYQRSLADRYAFEDSEGSGKDYQSETLFSAAWAYRQAGQAERAIETIRQGTGGGVALTGAAWWIAKWYSECDKYEEAAQHLRLESDDILPPPESWLLSSTLALAEVAKEQEGVRAARFVEELERKSPDTLRLLCGFTQEYWPRFSKLERESQQRWVYAGNLIHKKPLTPEFGLDDLRSAVKEFGWVLENELRTKIFRPFREEALHDPQFFEKARQDYKHKISEPFLSFIALGRDEFTCGQMIKALERTKSTSNEIERALASWRDNRFSRIPECVSNMKKLNISRTEATHKHPVYEREDVLSLASMCRQALAWI